MAFVWVNGVLRPASEPVLPVQDRGFLLGDGLFETLRVADGQALNLGAHRARMVAGATLLGMDAPRDFELAVLGIVEANGVRDGSVRVTLTRGSGGRGLDPPAQQYPVMVTTSAVHGALTADVRMRVVPQFRRDEVSPLSRIKALGYLPNVMARRAAVEQGAEDALMPNTQGRLACAVVANVLVWGDGGWQTPPLSEGALAGTGRAQLLEAGLVKEGVIGFDALGQADAVMLVNALGARKVTAVDGRVLEWPGQALAALEAVRDVLKLF